MVEPLVLDAEDGTESTVSLSIAGVDSRYYGRRLGTAPASAIKDESNNEGPSTITTEEEVGVLLLDNNSRAIASGPPSATTISLSSYESFGDSSESGMEEKDPFSVFEMGDHVYKWCSFMGIPCAYQHHAIILEVFPEDEESPTRYQVADFGNWRPDKCTNSSNPAASGSLVSSSSTVGGGDEKISGALRTYITDAKDWRKVRYEAGFWKRTFSWSGTSTSTMSDPPALVRARVQFLLEHPEVIPSYNTIFSNCECVALWCKTGKWTTLQASSWLTTSAAGQVKSAVTMTATVSAIQVPVTTTVPATGIMGWLGYTTQQTVQVSLLSTQPLLLPAIATFGVVTFGIPAVSLALAHQHWKRMTIKLNQEFWENAVAHPDIFVECITHWSTHLGS